ncbi:hypothetical protein GCM10010124_08670 [Pilimelia terevasa]|uniref:Uncharacterized protein n=1 Tax=Pilimelia terevasa TaxID=53372 RepID=A0A8J3BJ14_9ACTN|nr:hypothetical protein GCM10010124_08670 [Pilimelia terevasa]
MTPMALAAAAVTGVPANVPIAMPSVARMLIPMWAGLRMWCFLPLGTSGGRCPATTLRQVRAIAVAPGMPSGCSQ